MSEIKKRPKIFGKRSRLLLSMWPIVVSIGSNIATLTVLHIFYIKNCDFGFWPSRSSKIKSDCANRKPIAAFKKSSPAFNVVSVTVFKIFRIKGLWVWPLTSQSHPNSKVKPFLTYFTQEYDFDFYPLSSFKAKSDGANRKPVLLYIYVLQESNLLSVTVFKIFRTRQPALIFPTLQPNATFWGCAFRGLWPPNSNSAEIFCTMHLPPSFIFPRSEVIVLTNNQTNKQTNKQTDRHYWKTPNALRYATTLGNQMIVTSTFNLSRSYKVKPLVHSIISVAWSNIVTLAVLDIFNVKTYDFDF